MSSPQNLSLQLPLHPCPSLSLSLIHSLSIYQELWPVSIIILVFIATHIVLMLPNFFPISIRILILIPSDTIIANSGSKRDFLFLLNSDKLDPKEKEKFDLDAKCPHNEVMYNVKLRGGLLSGKFTDIGKVRSIKTCIRYCCQSQEKCDLAFLLKGRCYLVKCYNEERCQALPSPSIDYHFQQKMAFVAPWLYKKNRKLGKTRLITVRKKRLKLK